MEGKWVTSVTRRRRRRRRAVTLGYVTRSCPPPPPPPPRGSYTKIEGCWRGLERHDKPSPFSPFNPLNVAQTRGRGEKGGEERDDEFLFPVRDTDPFYDRYIATMGIVIVNTSWIVWIVSNEPFHSSRGGVKRDASSFACRSLQF